MWGFGTVTNDSRLPVVVEYPVAAGTRVHVGTAHATHGVARVRIGTVGLIQLVDGGGVDGRSPSGESGTGVLEIQAGENLAAWPYAEDDPLSVEVTVHQDGSFTLVGGDRELSGAFRGPAGPGSDAAAGGPVLG
ncbi:hypothetical protein [Streptomyces avicenniae]|uniref:hypothetical protein n=1 Tax=Streptomyces avicenniae TaxID=500153 RepID=UPI00069B9227|nr:hypothetical protein [Streptomyces avicenniae]